MATNKLGYDVDRFARKAWDAKVWALRRSVDSITDVQIAWLKDHVDTCGDGVNFIIDCGSEANADKVLAGLGRMARRWDWNAAKIVL
jgi:uncharacterized protein CbrC (UPF0167 family)